MAAAQLDTLVLPEMVLPPEGETVPEKSVTAGQLEPKRNGRKHRASAKPIQRNTEVGMVPVNEREIESLSARENDEADGKPNNGDETTEKSTDNLTPMVIVQHAKDAGTNFFQDQHGDTFAWIPTVNGDAHFECLRLRSRGFRARLLELIQSRATTSPQPSAIKQAIEVAELQAHGFQGIELANRRKTVGERTLIDLGDPGWNMVVVTRQGWNTQRQDGPIFYRTQHQRPLIEPAGGGDPYELFDYVQVDSDGEKLMVMAWVIAAMYPVVPNPMLLFVGQQGSAKTTRSRRLRSLLDPSVIPVQGEFERSTLFLTFQQHAVPCFENVSSFNRREADIFCRAVTGNGVERRKLYTDSDQVLYSFRRSIIINGMDTPSTRPDFLDRCLIIPCRRMEQFRTLQDLDQQFEAALPRLFGSMLDLLVQTLCVHDSTLPANEFRMADFARFGRAVTQALGRPPEDFDEAYRLNIRQQDFELVEDAPMTRVLKKFAAKHPKSKPWVGTADALLQELKYLANEEEDTGAKRDLPQSARWLSSRLGELSPALATQDVFVKKLPRTNASRKWEVYSPAPSDPNAEPDDIFLVLDQAGLDGKQE